MNPRVLYIGAALLGSLWSGGGRSVLPLELSSSAVKPCPMTAASEGAPADAAVLMRQFAADTMNRWPDGRFVPPGARWVWGYELGVLLDGIDLVWRNTEDPVVYNYIRNSIDPFVMPDGTIRTYSAQEYQLDSILSGRQLLFLYRTTHDPRYAKAAEILYQQLMQQPRTHSGGFWHKQRYPNQMWLDGLYMAEPFYAEYAQMFHHPAAFADITHQFTLMQQHAFDPSTGLLYHGWDESKKQRWANPQTGTSSQFWARAMGWYMMALVDTLPYYPANDPGRGKLLEILRKEAAVVVRYQDVGTGLWFQVMNRGGASGNYPESSASSMFVYALAKGVRLGYLPQRYLAASDHGFSAIVRTFVGPGKDCSLNLTGTVKAAGLGGNPYRDGSYRYYLSEKVVTNDPKGIGAFLLASGELAKLSGKSRYMYQSPRRKHSLEMR